MNDTDPSLETRIEWALVVGVFFKKGKKKIEAGKRQNFYFGAGWENH